VHPICWFQQRRHLSVIIDPKHDEHESMLPWIGGVSTRKGLISTSSIERCALVPP
jgi:hypothetical protein